MNTHRSPCRLLATLATLFSLLVHSHTNAANQLRAASAAHADSKVECAIDILRDLGWQTVNQPNAPGILNAKSCQHDLTPYFNLHSKQRALLPRIKSAIQSNTSRCLVNRALGASARTATDNIIANKRFVFPEPGKDPRDPFTPPASNWVPSKRHGYDIPSGTLADGIRSLYHEPVVAECAAAIQVAQVATLVEHFDNVDMIKPSDIGIGVWREFAKSPSIKADKTLLVGRKHRRRALQRLAALGRGAFFNQSGYISPVSEGLEYIDSLDNRGQNFLIVDITEQAVADLAKRRRPLRELNHLSLVIWNKYDRLRKTGLSMDILEELMENDLLAKDSFFSDITVYIHPLRTGNFAKFLARQFRYNPRTAYQFEVYEDFQTGYFFQKYVTQRWSMCEG